MNFVISNQAPKLEKARESLIQQTDYCTWEREIEQKELKLNQWYLRKQDIFQGLSIW